MVYSKLTKQHKEWVYENEKCWIKMTRKVILILNCYSLSILGLSTFANQPTRIAEHRSIRIYVVCSPLTKTFVTKINFPIIPCATKSQNFFPTKVTHNLTFVSAQAYSYFLRHSWVNDLITSHIFFHVFTTYWIHVKLLYVGLPSSVDAFMHY